MHLTSIVTPTHIVICTDYELRRQFTRSRELFAQPEIGDHSSSLAASIGVRNEYILWFDVAVDDFETVEMCETGGRLTQDVYRAKIEWSRRGGQLFHVIDQRGL